MTNAIVKPMYLFFDTLYTSTDLIGEETLSDWANKETPKLVYVVMSEEDAENEIIDSTSNGLYLANSLEEAEAGAEEMNA